MEPSDAQVMFPVTHENLECGSSMIFSPNGKKVLSVNNAGCEMDGADALFAVWNLMDGEPNQEFELTYKSEDKCARTASWIDDDTIDVEFETLRPPTYAHSRKRLIQKNLKKWIWDDDKGENPANQ